MFRLHAEEALAARKEKDREGGDTHHSEGRISLSLHCFFQYSLGSYS